MSSATINVQENITDNSSTNTDHINAFILEILPLNIMYCGRDWVIKYANQKTIDTLKKIEKSLPIPVSKLVGSKIDIFHKEPSRQHKLLNNDANLPYEVEFKLDDNLISLCAQALYDTKNNYSGVMVTWDIITEKRKIDDDLKEKSSQVQAVGRSMAIIEFGLDGTILDANDNFLNLLGYESADEVKGKHHRIFCETSYSSSPAYEAFWKSLNKGEHQASQYKRISKDGEEVWIQASYNPIFDDNGKPYKVVKYATDITDSKMRNAEFESKLNAISKSQAVIEFNLEGKVLNANDNEKYQNLVFEVRESASLTASFTPSLNLNLASMISAI